MLILVAMIGVVIFGAAALAVDLSIQTHNRRTLQNWTDTAALAGARDLPGSTKTAVSDALTAVLQNSPWSSTTSWASITPTAQAGGGYAITNYAGPGQYSKYSISISSPPLTPLNTSYTSTSYIEVEVKESVNNNIAGVIGQGTSTDGGHSIAYNPGTGQGFGWALYAQNWAGTGNQQETIVGDVYIGQAVQIQSSGKASFCAATNPDGSGGHIVLGPPQYPTSTASTVQWKQQHTNSFTDGPANGVTKCQNADGTPAVPTNSIDQMANEGCPTTLSTGQGFSGYDDSAYTKGCVSNEVIQPPTMAEPSLTGATTITTCTNPSLANGVFILDSTKCPGGLSVTQNTTWSCVTVVDTGGVPITFGSGGGITMSQSPFGSGCPGFTSSGDPNDGRIAIYVPSTTSATISIPHNGTTYTVTGSIYDPAGTVTVVTNAYINITGQAIVGTWDVQSGNHTNPDITYSAGASGVGADAMRLVE